MKHLVVVARSTMLALILGAVAFTPTTASALPHFGIHRHPSPSDGRVAVLVYNRGPQFRDLRIQGRVYTLPSHGILALKAPEGTGVFTETTGALHHKGDLLFSVTRAMHQHTVAID